MKFLMFFASQIACLTRLCKYYPGGVMGSRDAKSSSTITISGAPVFQEWRNTSRSPTHVVRTHPPQAAWRPCLLRRWWACERKEFSSNKPLHSLYPETVLSSQIFASLFSYPLSLFMTFASDKRSNCLWSTFVLKVLLAIRLAASGVGRKRTSKWDKMDVTEKNDFNLGS